MQWLRWLGTTGPVARRRDAFVKRAAPVVRRAVHIVAICIVLDAALRLVVGRRDLVGLAGLLVFVGSAVVIGVVLRLREGRLGLRAHMDEVALGLAALIIEYFAIAAVTARLA